MLMLVRGSPTVWDKRHRKETGRVDGPLKPRTHPA